ncbi:MAG: hypothetical protein WCB27_22220 [Thermoguttaceae bacterium]|jgi:hypothetical protein
MEEEILQSRLSRISTMWDVLARSRRSPPDAADDRWVALLQRYQGVVYRYLLGSVRDPDAADELEQELSDLDLLPFCRSALARRRERQ